MAHTGWFESLVSAAIWLTPLYLLSQVWLASAWEGRWLWVALAPVLGLLPAMIVAFAGLSHQGSQWWLAFIFFVPVACTYFLIAVLVRIAVAWRRAA